MATMLSFLPLVIFFFSILLLQSLCSVCKIMVASFLSYRCAHVCCFLAVDPLCQLAKRNRWGGAAWTQLNTSETHSQLIVSPSPLSLSRSFFLPHAYFHSSDLTVWWYRPLDFHNSTPGSGHITHCGSVGGALLWPIALACQSNKVGICKWLKIFIL